MKTRFLSAMMLALGVVLVLAAAYPPGSAAQRRDPATVTLAADLRQSADPSSVVISTLAAGQPITVLEMRGRDAKVDAAGQVGWMAAAKLRIGTGSGPAAGGGSGGGASWLRGLTGMLGGGSSGGKDAQVPIGVRGLQKDDLARAQPDPQAVQRLESWRASADDGLAHARAAGLDSYQVAYRETASFAGSARGNAGSGATTRSERDN